MTAYFVTRHAGAVDWPEPPVLETVGGAARPTTARRRGESTMDTPYQASEDIWVLPTHLTVPTVGVIPKSYKAEGYLESKQVPQDPWKTDYVYLSPGEHGDYDLCSLGADGVKGGEEKNADICSWDIK